MKTKSVVALFDTKSGPLGWLIGANCYGFLIQLGCVANPHSCEPFGAYNLKVFHSPMKVWSQDFLKDGLESCKPGSSPGGLRARWAIFGVKGAEKKRAFHRGEIFQSVSVHCGHESRSRAQKAKSQRGEFFETRGGSLRRAGALCGLLRGAWGFA